MESRVYRVLSKRFQDVGDNVDRLLTLRTDLNMMINNETGDKSVLEDFLTDVDEKIGRSIS